MGCWSESCALSGMEIPNGADIYVTQMQQNKYYPEKWDILIPPLRGKYDDYGGIELAEASNLFNKAGLWRPRDEAVGFPAYIRADVFDLLTDIPTEMTWRGKTIREIVSKEMKIFDNITVLPGGASARLTNYEASRIAADLFYMGASYFDRVYYEESEKLGEFMTALERCMILKMAACDLRKALVPLTQGPQHNGADALLYFNKKVIKLVQKEERLRNSE